MRNTKQIICVDTNFVKKRRVEIMTKHKDDKKVLREIEIGDIVSQK